MSDHGNETGAPQGALYRFNGLVPQLADGAWVAPGARLIGDVRLGRRANVWFNAVLRGDLQPVVVGDETNVQDGAVLHVDLDKPCVVGCQVTIGHLAMVHACEVEDGVLIGMQATVLSGARIGAGSVIAAGAVVLENEEIPPRSLVVGVPGRVVRTLDADGGRRNAAHYLDAVRQYQRDFGPVGS